jgi:hypothetical protein
MKTEKPKLDYTPVIILIEKKIMELSLGLAMVDIAGLTPTEIEIMRKKHNDILEPYRDAVMQLKCQTHNWTNQERYINAIANVKPFTIP